MKRLVLYLILTLFAISCGEDNDPIKPNPHEQSESLFPIADGNRWYMTNSDYYGNSYNDTVQFYYTFKREGEYYFQSNPVILYTLYYVEMSDTTTPSKLGLMFEFENYMYYTSEQNIKEHTIQSAEINIATHLEEEGETSIGKKMYDVKKIDYDFNGKTYKAWQMTLIDSSKSYTGTDIYIPGIGIAYRSTIDNITGYGNKKILYKYELN